jgi:hypothetical protein
MLINSTLTKSPHFEIIMENYDKFGRKMNRKAFLQQYIHPYEPKITYKVWRNFLDKYNDKVVEKTTNIIEKYVDKHANENAMEKSSLQNILKISGATLEELINEPDILKSIPVKERMKWLFSAMKARDSRMVALTKVQAEKRKTSMFEDMLQGAQYGEVEEEEINDFNQDPPSQEPSQEIPAPKLEAKVVEFSPNDL